MSQAQRQSLPLLLLLLSPPQVDFEEVPAVADFSSDDEAVATTLALGTRMLEKRQRTAILDASYNRYAVDLSERSALAGVVPDRGGRPLPPRSCR